MDDLSKALIDRYQRDLPITQRPYAAMARDLGVSEAEVIEALHTLLAEDVISRVGPVLDHARAGASMLVAAAVPPEELETVGRRVSAFEGVNHNYAREHHFNLWFVITAPDRDCLVRELAELERVVGVALLELPMEKSYHIDLSFDVDWSAPEARA